MKAFCNSEWEQHKAETQEKWGQTDAYKEHVEKTKDYSKQKWNDLTADLDRIMAEFARCMQTGEAPDSAEAQRLVSLLQNHITTHYYRCTDTILAGLGQLYVADQRFQTNNGS